MDSTQSLTKASQIMALAAEGHTTRVIAGIVYGLTDADPQTLWDKRTAYVRVVSRQRMGSGMSDIDRRHALRKYGSMQNFYAHRNKATYDRRCDYYKARRRNDPVWRDKQNAISRARYRKRCTESFKQAAMEALQRLERISGGAQQRESVT